MALIVEDGTVVANAESYCSVAFADAYHLARGNTTWATITTAEREQALRRATDYMEQAFRSRWKGYRKSATQVLSWPRSYVYLEPFVTGGVGSTPYLVADNIVASEVQKACAELAWRAAAGNLMADLTRAESSVRVGDIAVTYDPHSSESTRYKMIEAILGPYFGGSSLSVPLMRT